VNKAISEELKMLDLQSNKDLECIIDPPLCSCEGTDHDNTEWKAPGEQTDNANLLHSLHIKEEANQLTE
jgi:hypothetical protein